MSRIALLGALIYVIILSGIGTLNGALLGLVLPLILYLLAALWRAPEELKLTAERSLSNERIVPGETITVSLKVTNQGQALDQVLLYDLLPKFLEVIEGSASRFVSLPAGASLEWSYTVRGRRGFHAFTELNCIAEDKLGLIQKRAALRTRGQVHILPPIASVKRIVIRPRQTRVYSGVIPANEGGAGIEFFGLREYQMGDSPQHINWHASARYQGTLFTNEFQQERVANVGIILDGRKKVNEFGGERSIFEHSVLASVAVSSALLAEGNHVGLLVYGRRIKWTTPGYGKRQRERIMQDLALADTGAIQNFDSLIIPHRILPANSQIILISPLLASDVPLLISLRLSGYQVMVISPDPVTFEARGLGDRESVNLAARIARIEREVILRRLRAASIQVINWNTSLPFEQAARATLSRPSTFLRAIQRGRL
jgi:uncharacterized protein (DUF58 family)